MGSLMSNPNMTSSCTPEKLVEYAYKCYEIHKKKQKVWKAKENEEQKKKETGKKKTKPA
jgi:endonuclease IV